MADNSFLSFLMQGQPQQGTNTSSTYGPSWLSDAQRGLVGAATNLASQPYQSWTGPYTATPSDATKSAWNMAQSNVGSYQPYLQQAAQMTGQAGAPITSSDVSTFMNPYQDYITQGLTTNFNQNVLPSIQDRFVSAGQSRSPQEAQVTGNATRDLNTSIGQSLAGAYQGALSSLQQERQQQGQLGAQYGQLGALSSQLGAQDISQLAAAGQGQDTLSQANINAARQEFQNQQQYPYQQIGFLSNILNGMPLSATGSTTSSAGTYYPQTNSGLSSFMGSANALSGMGYRRGGQVHPQMPFRSALSTVRG